MEKGDLAETNRALTARLDQCRTASRKRSPPKMRSRRARRQGARRPAGRCAVSHRQRRAHAGDGNGIQVLAEAVASLRLSSTVDGYADPRGTWITISNCPRHAPMRFGICFSPRGSTRRRLEVQCYGRVRVLRRQRRLCTRASRASDLAGARQAGSRSPGSGPGKAGPSMVPGSGESLQVNENE